MARRSTWVEPDGHADDDARARAEQLEVSAFLMNCLSICSVTGEVGDHAVLHRADDGDAARRLAEHLFGFHADGLDGFLALGPPSMRMATTDGSSRTMPAAHVNQRVGGAKVDGQIVGKVTARKPNILEPLRVGVR